VILLGACSGAGTVTAALRALQEEAHSKLPALGYTVPYALGNILLTAWGPILVALMRYQSTADGYRHADRTGAGPGKGYAVSRRP
jgi:Predicted Permease Membrane Region